MPDPLAQFDRCIERIAVEAATRITLQLREDTPVDTGLAQASWIPAKGTRIDTPTDSVSTQESKQASGLASIRSFRISDGRITISNAQPYIRFLNEGSSVQAPAGFVEAAVIRGVASAATSL